MAIPASDWFDAHAGDIPAVGTRVELYSAWQQDGFTYNRHGVILKHRRSTRLDVTYASFRPDAPLPEGKGSTWGFFLGHKSVSQYWRYIEVPATTPAVTPPTERDTMHSNEYTYWATTLRVKDGYVAVIVHGNPDEGVEESTVVWQGDLTKPHTNDDSSLGENAKSGQSKAYKEAEAIINTAFENLFDVTAKALAKGGK